jgi:mannose-6-phosphate isomerase-like protein (cupin superfamily)
MDEKASAFGGNGMQPISRDQIREPLVSDHGEIVYELVGQAAEHGGAIQHSVAYIVIPTGKSSLAHYHQFSEETYYILKGVARMVIDEDIFSFSPGQACLILPGQTHRIFNTGEGDLEFLAVSAPAWVPGDSYFDV